MRATFKGPDPSRLKTALSRAGASADDKVEALISTAAVAVQEAGAVIVRYIETSGEGMPYKHEKHTPRRYKTGRMLDTAGHRTGYEVLTRTRTQFRARVGFTGADRDYIRYQEEGTSKLRGMLSLPASKQVLLNRLSDGGFK